MTEHAKPALAQTAAPSGAGGSSAGRAYREELARQGRLPEQPKAPPPQGLAPTPNPVAAPAATVDARAAERKKMNGRAQAVLPNGKAVAGKMVDISLTGACVLMEDMFPSRTRCVLEFDIFHNGRRQLFSTPAVSVYGVLASGKGFKVGFQFGPSSPAASKSIAELMA